MDSWSNDIPNSISNIKIEFPISDHYNILNTTNLRNTIRKETPAIHKIELEKKTKIMFDGVMVWCQDIRTKFLRVIKHCF